MDILLTVIPVIRPFMSNVYSLHPGELLEMRGKQRA